MTLPPFLAGQEAYEMGKPLTANPHPDVQLLGDEYPGACANWNAGWWTAKHRFEHAKGKGSA